MSGPTKAVILAAGVGRRLLPLTADRPKALVEVEGTPMLGRLLDACERCGLSEAIVVTGHRHEQVVGFLERHAGAIGTRAVFNPQHDSLNNAHSLWLAREAVGTEGFVKLDGDLVLHASALAGLLACPWPSAIAIDTSGALDDEAMKARVAADGRVEALGKWLAVDEASGESIGAEKIAAEQTAPLFEAIERVVHVEGRGDAYYEDVYHVLADGDAWPLGSCEIDGGAWSEVDDEADLERAGRLVRSW